ncbi:nucleotide pyrophosphohydrolase [Candidatus Dojkabacteria bacterium]|nr:nucleotide pyrophosphohydrolase [Candidatus Dojkabacteria bacterium]
MANKKSEKTLVELESKAIDFREQRDWEQFHNPKNIAGSIAIEASELLEVFQWAEGKDSKKLAKKRLQEVKDEMADVLVYLVTLAHDLNIDLIEAAIEKIEKNDKKYPVEKAKGKSTKYTELKQ